MTIPALPTEFQRFHTGSRFICNPAVMNTDDDWVILVGDMAEASDYLSRSGWMRGGSARQRGEGVDFVSYKMTTWVTDPNSDNPFGGKADTDNAIVTSNHLWYHKMKVATSIAKRLNILEKDDRIALFAAIMDSTIDEQYMIESVALAPPFLPLPESEAPQASVSAFADSVDEAIYDELIRTADPLAPPSTLVTLRSSPPVMGRMSSGASNMSNIQRQMNAYLRTSAFLDGYGETPAMPQPEGRLVRFRRFLTSGR